MEKEVNPVTTLRTSDLAIANFTFNNSSHSGIMLPRPSIAVGKPPLKTDPVKNVHF